MGMKYISSVTVFFALLALIGAERSPTLLSNEIQKSPNGHGVLKPLENAHVLQLNGSPYEKGYAHGYLLANQIIDWSYFYQFQYNMGKNVTYYTEFSDWLIKNQFVTEDYKQEVSGIYAGMKDSKVSLYVDGLDRDFTESDIYVMNAYLEGTPNAGALQPGPFAIPRPKKSSGTSSSSTAYVSSNVDGHIMTKPSREPPACTQFVAWGHLTSDSETLAGRNMDGETDPWYVTVTHLIVFAVEPQSASEVRYISIMWPGHVGTLTSMNEEGVSMMLNCGAMNSGPIATNLTVIEYSIKNIISTTRAVEATPSNMEQKLRQFTSSEGGISGAGSIVVFSTPAYLGTTPNANPGFIAELDRYDTVMRTVDTDTTHLPVIAQSNHFLQYGVDSASESDSLNPLYNFGEEVGFSSRWRLQAIRGVLESFNATGTKLQGLTTSSSRDAVRFGVDRVMQAPAHGYTEHGVAFAPRGGKRIVSADGKVERSRPRFALANSNVGAMWDAPYLKWVEYDFDEMFV